MDFQAERNRLLQHLASEVKSHKVLDAMSRVPRELFVPQELRHMAYEDRPLPIGLGQTISQPYIVALMTQELYLQGDEKVLEIGTGSGYQTAILAELAREVITVERFAPLARSARQLLKELGYTNVTVHLAEKTLGWRWNAPYDAIMVTAGAPSVPEELIDQLAVGGRMVIPVGSQSEQELLRVTRKDSHTIGRERLTRVRFVPLVGKGAWEEE
jgi:protein-L-isoaspartate(D-aspartate) O-methyltransferase